MRRPLVACLALVLLVSGVACSTTGEGGTRRSSNLITAEELQPLASFTALEAVRRLRPAWLRVRNAASPPVVFIDGVRMGGPEILDTYRAADFVEMRHRSGPDATTLYGTGVGGGTIELRSRSP